MTSQAAGLLMCRQGKDELEYFLVHPGGPYFQKKNEGWWSIPKGLPEENEKDMLVVACREFMEESGLVPSPPYHALGSVKEKGGKTVHAWAFIGNWSPADGIRSNAFEIEWPPKSGRLQKFPEADRAGWFNMEQATIMIKDTQLPFLHRAREIFR